MSAKASASLNNNVPAQAPAKTGAGQTGLTAVATVSPTATKAVAVTPPAIVVATHQVLGSTPPATATGFDRTVATSYGK